MDAQQTSDMGIHAAQVLENPAFNEALRLMREDVLNQWKACPIRDREGQMLLLQAAKLTDKVESTLRGMLEAGKLASAKLDIEAARSESKVKRALRAIG
jgi:hypothetical protein